MQVIFRNRLYLSTGVLGLTSIVVQILLIRQFLVVFHGNELVMGILLANWMWLTGAGAYLGRFFDRWKTSQRLAVFFHLFLSVLPLVLSYMFFVVKDVLFPSGMMPGIVEVFYLSLFLLAPFCLVSGSMFTFLSKMICETSLSNRIGLTYGIESLGSMTGGILFNFLLVFLLEPFQILYVIMVLNLLMAFFILSDNRGSGKWIVLVLAVGLIFFFIKAGLSQKAQQLLFKGQEVIFQKETPYGNLAVTHTAGQTNIYENGIVLYATGDVIGAEESVHYAMVQHPDPRQVLLLSGGMPDVIAELNKYKNTECIDYVELNPWIIGIGKEIGGYAVDSGIFIHRMDARSYIRQTGQRYDVVLVNLPDPTTAQFNRYYSSEFYSDLKKILGRGGIVCTRLSSTANYMSEEARKVNAVHYFTLKEHFGHIQMVPGGRNYYLASDNPFNDSITRLIERKGIETVYVNKYYLDDELLRDRAQQILSVLNNTGLVNHDFKPVSYYLGLQLWLSYFHVEENFVLVLVILLLTVVLAMLRPIPLGLFTGGFAASSVEFLLLIVFQVIYGYVYQMAGIIIMVFMGGLAAGAMPGFRLPVKQNKKGFARLILLMALFCILFPLMIRGLEGLRVYPVPVHAGFILITFFCAMIGGMTFRVSASLYGRGISETAGHLYAADLAGSAFGVLLVSVFLLPLLGVDLVCLVIGLLNVISAIRILWKK